MNIIKNIGDFKKALSVYPDDAEFDFCEGAIYLGCVKADIQIHGLVKPSSGEVYKVKINLVRE